MSTAPIGDSSGPSPCRLELTEETGYQLLCGPAGGGGYAVKVSRKGHPDWRMAVGDFCSFCRDQGKPFVLEMSQQDQEEARRRYEGHRHHDPFLRPGEPRVWVHSTSLESWEAIRRDGRLKCWKALKLQGAVPEERPVGALLDDPEDFSDYIMFGQGAACELIVSSRQKGAICMDAGAPYLTGARLYFDGARIARDGLLVRDGCHLKVRGELPLEPYLLWAATWDQVGLKGRASTPAEFARRADQAFSDRLDEKLQEGI